MHVNTDVWRSNSASLLPLEREDEELGVVLVVEGRKGDGPVVPRLQPVHLLSVVCFFCWCELGMCGWNVHVM